MNGSFYIFFILMLMRCASQTLKKSSSLLYSQGSPSLIFRCRAASMLQFHFSQPRHNLLAPSSSQFSLASQENHSIEFGSLKSQISQPICFQSGFGRIHRFEGDQRNYFVFIAVLLFLFNMAARLSMKQKDHRHQSYERKNYE